MEETSGQPSLQDKPLPFSLLYILLPSALAAHSTKARRGPTNLHDSYKRSRRPLMLTLPLVFEKSHSTSPAVVWDLGTSLYQPVITLPSRNGGGGRGGKGNAERERGGNNNPWCRSPRKPSSLYHRNGIDQLRPALPGRPRLATLILDSSRTSPPPRLLHTSTALLQQTGDCGSQEWRTRLSNLDL